MSQDDLVPYITQVFAATQQGKFKWIPVNPTTYSLETDRGTLTIQKKEPSPMSGIPAAVLPPALRPDVEYVLRIIEKDLDLVLVSISSATSVPLAQILGMLFDAAERSVTVRAITFLQQILKS